MNPIASTVFSLAFGFVFLFLIALPGLLLLLFATRTMVFSKRLAKAGFSPQEESLNFRRYLMDFFLFLSFAVMAALVGGLLAVLYGSIFPS